MVSHSFTLSLAPDGEAARHARAATSLSLHEWDMKELLDDATLVVSELVANAAKLGQSFDLRLSAYERTLRIEVTDHSPGKPAIKTGVGDDRAEDGRGLLLVDALADIWGFDVGADDRKIVWAVLTCP